MSVQQDVSMPIDPHHAANVAATPTAPIDAAQLNTLVQTLQAQATLIQSLHTQLSTLQPSSNLRARPPKPDRYKGGRDVLAWSFKFERYCTAAGIVTDKEQCELAASLMDGVAANWLRCLFASASRSGGRPLPATWNDFKVALTRQFQPLADEDDAQQKLDRLHHRDSVRQYVQVFLDTAMRLPEVPEKVLLYRFKQGLKKPCLEYVTLHKPTTLTDAMAAAEEWEQIHKGIKARERVARSFAHEADGMEPMQLGTASGRKTQQGAVKNGQKVGSNRSVRTCYHCGKPGHIARECRSRKAGHAPKVNSASSHDHSDSEEN